MVDEYSGNRFGEVDDISRRSSSPLSASNNIRTDFICNDPRSASH